MAQRSKPLNPKPRRQSQSKNAEERSASEIMQASGEIQVGKYINLKGAAQITPAGVICAGMAGVAVLAAATVLVYFARRET